MKVIRKKFMFLLKGRLKKVQKQYIIYEGGRKAMLKRKMEQRLTEWKNTKNHKPLIIKGCRQCGKTFSVLNFAKNNYKNVVYLNFLRIQIVLPYFQVLWK